MRMRPDAAEWGAQCIFAVETLRVFIAPAARGLMLR
jgi:hypothetical protein